jgi:hypothetical protein
MKQAKAKQQKACKKIWPQTTSGRSFFSTSCPAVSEKRAAADTPYM